MKKLISLLTALTLCLGLFSCAHSHQEDDEVSTEGFVQHFESGVYYSLPKDFVTKKLSYGDYVYTNGEKAYLVVNVYDQVELEENMRISKDVSVREYAQMIVTARGCSGYKYDEKTDTATFDYVYEYNDGSGFPNEYYLYKILRNESALYQIYLSCDEDDLPKYQKTFNAVLKTIVLE